MGVAAVETEIGGQGTITREGQRLSRQIILRFLDFWNILPWKEASIAIAPVEVEHIDIFAGFEGLFESGLGIGDEVTPGSMLGIITDLEGKPLQTLTAPRVGKVAILRTFASIQAGDRLVQLFIPSKAV